MWTLSTVEVARSGELGFTVGVAVLPSEPAGGPEEREVGYFRIWKVIEGGAWRVVLDLLLSP